MSRAAPGGALREGRSRPRIPLPGARPAPARSDDGKDGDAGLAPAVQLRRRRRLGRGRVLLAGVAVAGIAAWGLLASPFVAVDRVDVTGASPRWIGQVRAAADGELGRPVGRVDAAAVAARIRAVPGVLTASVGVRWPHTLTVHVVERVPAVGVRVGSKVRVFDASGVELGVGPAPGRVPLVVVPTRALTPATVVAALRVRQALPRRLAAQVAELGARSPDGVWLVLRDGTHVVWGSAHDAAGKLGALTALRKAARGGRGHTVDVSAPDAPAVS
jgi:cell division protein FtsQ